MDNETTLHETFMLTQTATPVSVDAEHLSSEMPANSSCPPDTVMILNEFDNESSLPIENNTLEEEVMKNSTDAVFNLDTNIRLSGPVLEMIYITTSILIIISNLVAICVFLSNKKLRSQMDIKFLIWQSCVDLLAGVFLSTTTINNKYIPSRFEGVLGTFLCKYWYSGFPLWVMFMNSTLNLNALSFFKYFAVVHPLFFKVHITKAKAYIMMFIPFAVALVFYIALFETSTGVVDGEVRANNMKLSLSLFLKHFIGALYKLFTLKLMF